MLVTKEHLRWFDTCSSCGRRVGEEHINRLGAACHYVRQRFPATFKLLDGWFLEGILARRAATT